MRVALFTLLLLAGCSSALYKTPDLAAVDTKGRDQTCVRSCVSDYSQCTSRTAMTDQPFVQAKAAQSCYAAHGACVKTCPTS